jgi:CRISPR-associated protein Cmr3
MNTTTMQKTWVELEATAPLSLGTGKPLGFAAGADSRAFPWPSVTAGALRAAAAVDLGLGPDPEHPEVAHLKAGAPCLVRRNAQGHPEQFFPCPQDLIAVRTEAGSALVPLTPQPLPTGVATDLSVSDEGLLAPAPTRTVKAKPGKVDAWWREDLLLQWLQEPAQVTWPAAGQTLTGPVADRRTHVGIEPHSGGPMADLLFRSAGADFGARRDQLLAGQLESFAIGLPWWGPRLDKRQRRVGGEGRACHIRQREVAAGPKRPAALWSIRQGERFRLLLISPAVFSQGWLPDGLSASNREGRLGGEHGPRVRLISAALPRTQVHSGWVGGQPGQPRRVVPAGTVYWCEAMEDIAGDALWQVSLCAAPWADSGWGVTLWGRA